MTHAERLESLAEELDKVLAFLDPPKPGETHWQELDAISLRAGADAIVENEALKTRVVELEAVAQWQPIREATEGVRLDVVGCKFANNKKGWLRGTGYYKTEATRSGFTHFFTFPDPPREGTR